MSAPVLQRPTYIGLAGADQASQAVSETVAKIPFAGVVGGAVVGAIVFYFVPKVLDRMLAPPAPENVSFEVED